MLHDAALQPTDYRPLPVFAPDNTPSPMKQCKERANKPDEKCRRAGAFFAE